MKSAVLITIITVSLIQVKTAEIGCAAAPKPDFSAPGRRLSEQMCRTYNWERKNLEKCSAAQDVEINEHSYLGAIGFKSDNEGTTELLFACTAFLVSPKFAVTAAHCVRGINNFSPDIIRFGNNNIKANVPTIDAKIIRKISHPSYIASKFPFDIALLELENALPLSRAVMPACLWTQPGVGGDDIGEVSAALQNRKEAETPVTIKTMKVLLINSKNCLPLVQSYFTRGWRQLEDHQLCANESLSAEHLYNGLSGAPIISSVAVDGEDKMPFAIGISSFGFGRNGAIGIYTRISSFVDWIEETVWKAAQPL